MKFFIRALVLSGLFLVVFGGYRVLIEDRSWSDISCAARWSVARASEQNRYDLILVGAGLGGLSCAVPLAKQGYKILILEGQDHLGGFYTSFEKYGSVLSAGVTDVTGCGNPGPVSYLLEQAGLSVSDYFVPLTREIVYHNKKIILTGNSQELCQQLIGYFPHEREAITSFLQEACAVYAENYDQTVAQFGVPLMPRDFIRAYGILKFPGYIWGHRTTGKWASVSFRSKVNSWFHDQELKHFWEHLLEYAGLPIETTPALIGVFAVIMPLINGSCYPKGGCQKLITSLQNFLHAHGATIITGQQVDKILINHGCVMGVQAGSQVYKSPLVVANLHAQTVFEKLLDPTIVPPVWFATIKQLPLASSAAVVHMGFSDLGDGWVEQVAARATHLVDLDTTCHVVINSNADHAVVPKNQVSMTTFFVEPYTAVPLDYGLYKKTFVERALARIEKTVPGARKHFLWSEVLTPRSFEHWCGAPSGACYGFDLSHGGSAPSYKTPIQGLYLASASAQFGGGVEAVVMTGLTCAHDIMGWRV